jgi:hypothetical protein
MRLRVTCSEWCIQHQLRHNIGKVEEEWLSGVSFLLNDAWMPMYYVIHVGNEPLRMQALCKPWPVACSFVCNGVIDMIQWAFFGECRW